jgi:plastocyanin
MKPNRKVLLACAVATALAGCGGAAGTYPQSAEMHGDPNTALPFHYTLSRTVTFGDRGFSPDRLSVPVNTTIRWVNRSRRALDVIWTGGNAPNFESGPLLTGQAFAIRMPGVTTVTYRSRPGDFQGAIQVGSATAPEAVRGGHHRA